MKIIVVSDLHIRIENDKDFISNIIESLVERIRVKILENEKIVMVVLGDIIDRGNENAKDKYNIAKEILMDIQAKLGICEFFFIPGNHDISYDKSLEDFNQFVSCFPNSEKFDLEKSVHYKVEDGINMIFADSNLTRNYQEDGVVNIELIKKCLSQDQINIIFMHHPPMSQNKGDKAIHNTQALLSTHSDIVFYGHQHGEHVNKDYFKTDTYFHAIGSLFEKHTDVSNDFAFLEVNNGRITYAYRFDYNGVKFVPHLLYPSKNDIKSLDLMLDKPRLDENSLINNRMYVDKNGQFTKIDNIIKKYDYIIISGQAGVGKSYEMSNVYFILSHSDDYFPIWIDMKNADEQRIFDCLGYLKNNTIDNRSIVLLIDGLNETTGNSFQKIVREISGSIRGNVQVKVIVSKRQNIDLVIDDFQEFSVEPLNAQEIKKYAISREIQNPDDFINQMKIAGFESLSKIPFYLVELTNIYKQSGKIPSGDMLMLEIVENRLTQCDRDHYTDELIRNENQIFECLAKIGFIMQSTQKYLLPNINYTCLISEDKRQLLAKTGLINIAHNPTSVNFTHDIFREFFIAYCLKGKTLEKILEVITLPNYSNRIRSSWLNIISFILRMRTEKDLLGWMITNEPIALCDMEFDGFPLKEKNNYFISILQYCFDTKTPIHIHYPNVRKIAKYFQSNEVLQPLICKLSENLKEYDLSTICQIIMYSNNDIIDIELRKQIVSLLLEKAKKEYPDYIIRFIMKALLNIGGDQITEIAKNLLPRVYNITDPFCLVPFFEMILLSEQCDLFWPDIKSLYHNLGKTEYLDYDTNHFFVQICSSLKDVENYMDAISFLCGESRFRYAYDFEKKIIYLVERLLPLIEMKDDFILEKMLELYVDIQTNIRQSSKIFIPFFSKNYGKKRVLAIMVQIYKQSRMNHTLWFALSEVVKVGMNKELIEEYKNDNIDADFINWYSFQISEDSTEWQELNECYFKKTNKNLPHHEVLSWEEKTRLQTKEYFDSLFSKEKYISLMIQLIEIVGKDTTCAEVWEKYYSNNIFDNETFNIMIRHIIHFKRFFKSDMKLSDFFEKNNWNIVSEVLIMETLSSYESIEINDMEEDYIKRFFSKTICSVQLEDFNTDGYVRWQVDKIVMLMKKYSYVCTDEILLKMLMIPSPVFGETSTLESSALEFISTRIHDQALLRDRIIYNINNVDMEDMIIHTHILYCYNQKINEGVNLALKTIHSKSHFAAYAAIDYLISQRGEAFVDSHIDFDISEDLLKYLYVKLLKRNSNLCSIMIARNKDSGNRWLFLNELIALNNRYGLQVYTDFIKKHKCIPELYDRKDEKFPYDITSKISEIKDLSLMDLISDLIIIAFSDEFKDKDMFGLKYSLGNVIRTYSDIDPNKTVAFLNCLLTLSMTSSELSNLCYYHLRDIQGKLQKNDDVPWSIEKAIQFYSE